MYTRHALFFRILLSLLILIGLLWLALWGWLGTGGPHSTASTSKDPSWADSPTPLFWEGKVPSPIAYTPLAT